MSNMTQAELALLFQQGVVKEWKIEKEAITGDWIVSFLIGLSWTYLKDVRRKEIKRFKSADAAVSSLQFIGFEIKEIKSC